MVYDYPNRYGPPSSDFNPKRAEYARQYDMPIPMVNDETDTDTNTGSTADQCCEDIRQQYIELSNRLHGEDHHGTQYLLDLSCDELRDHMKRDLQQEYHPDYGPLHDPETWDNPENVQFREDVAQLLREWDDCLRPGMTSTDDTFVRSGDSFEDAWQIAKKDESPREKAKRILIERHGEDWYKKYKESMGRKKVDPRRNLKPNPGDVPGKPWRMCIDCEKNSALSDSPYCHACQTIRWETDNPEYVGKSFNRAWSITMDINRGKSQ